MVSMRGAVFRHTAAVSTTRTVGDLQFFRAVLVRELDVALGDALLALLKVVTSAGAGGRLFARCALASRANVRRVPS